ncbi:MAG: hypothetical protein M1358_18405 [Chloroflexi bacterium]|nr:hypothetical protein [Chloroflexota bacterium]
MAVSFRKDILEAKLLNPLKNFALDTKIAEVRYDPLTGRTCRIIERFNPPVPSKPDITPLIEKSRNCFFCAEKVEKVTPKIRPEISSEERIKVGEAILFPNLTAYGQYSGVCIYSKEHFTELGDLTPELVANNLKANRRYLRMVADYDPSVEFCSINANYLPPAGSSIFHPHTQSTIDPLPTNLQRELVDCSQAYYAENRSVYWLDLIAAEREQGERYLGTIGGTAWLVSFAPLGFHEVQGIVSSQSSLAQMDDSDLDDLAVGISKALKYYADQNFNSFNLAIYSGPIRGSESFRVNLRLVSRSNLEPYYRSDATYFERLHLEAMVDRQPEDIASDLRKYFE